MTILKDGEYKPATEEEMVKFYEANPEIAKILLDSEALRNLPVESASNVLYDSWD
jgi:hypothetical protein